MCCLAITAQAAPGDLDTSFGNGGKVTTPFGTNQSQIRAIVIQTDGKIVVAGDTNDGSNNDFALARYNTDGSLDTSFGTGGKIITPIGSGTDAAFAVAIQSDGKIVLAGYAHNGANYDFALARYNTDGTLDPAFGTGGKVTTPFGGGNDYAFAMKIQSDGKIVVAGRASNGTDDDFALARYNPNGMLDTGFGAGGKVTTPIGSGNDYLTGLALQTDGKIVVGGVNDGAAQDFALARYNTDGSLDTSFGTGGKVITSIGNNADLANAVVIQADGKIVAVGDRVNGQREFALARYNSNGSLDSTLERAAQLLISGVYYAKKTFNSFHSGFQRQTAIANASMEFPDSLLLDNFNCSLSANWIKSSCKLERVKL